MRVQIIGFGNIGQGFAEILIRKNELLRKRYALELKVVSITDITGTAVDEKGLDLSKALEVMKKGKGLLGYPGAKKMNGLEAIETVDADVVVEATPTKIIDGEPGLGHMLLAMEKGRHVVTSNKGPLALKFSELKDAARKNQVKFKFEASVGGAMPIINFAKETLSGDKIYAIEGILNGTTNYILTRMSKEERPFETVLREAQEIGIAEADPSYDIDGIDTACKLVILANTIMGIKATYKDVSTQGIRKITPEAVKLAKEDGYAIKLIGEVKNSHLEVSPRLVPVNHSLNVEGVLNVALFKADIAGDITIIGKGAGAIETNSAVLSDLISIWRNGMR
ncbi:MAG: homoserine dehydrogenase [Candidatus Hydrothermarchaeota archaeon]|jgi:homoserine dehydrogenase|nr:homoserine dehydrogenase [Candidatus Hydrothermarchaeota archaeon]